jgi:branched-chain amino acid transport system permease protein
MLIFDILNNLSSITNGPLGLRNIPRFSFLSSLAGAAIFAVLSACTVYLVLLQLSRSAWGTNLRAIRDDDVMMMTLGKRVARIKTVTFSISALIAGYVGILFAQYVTFIDPTSFTLSESIIVLSMVIVGGLGSIHGTFWAAVVLVGLPEAIRFVGLPGIAEGNARQIIYGVALVVIILVRDRADAKSVVVPTNQMPPSRYAEKQG